MIHDTFGRAIRTVTVDPYQDDENAPTFTLHCFDTGDGGLGYELWMREQGRRTRLFEGADYNSTVKPASDLSIALLFAALTAPRDDEEMSEFTPEQKAFVRKHGEPVYKETYERFRAPLVTRPRERKEPAPVVNIPQHRFRITGGEQVG
jgi:hypothetical protein